ncbi:uncharacterized protein LOC126626846 isoform X1 [Malus sylvestris]|uniref:uncharacterized protein LOC126626846 isoform X1 n=1 Tax=Malus sylvestris TaxID=3752 RepID=UPI0021ACAF6C|nr:uncharacterized protein LOC126626846 isoform X1 [Malus sylvestris]
MAVRGTSEKFSKNMGMFVRLCRSFVSHIGETYPKDERSQGRLGGYAPLTYQTITKQPNSSSAWQTSLRNESQELVPGFQQSASEKSSTGILATAALVLLVRLIFSLEFEARALRILNCKLNI